MTTQPCNCEAERIGDERRATLQQRNALLLPFSTEDLDHITEAICDARAGDVGLKALPGLEYVRNKIAVRVAGVVCTEGSVFYGSPELEGE
jgi:hypothetical protein